MFVHCWGWVACCFWRLLYWIVILLWSPNSVEFLPLLVSRIEVFTINLEDFMKQFLQVLFNNSSPHKKAKENKHHGWGWLLVNCIQIKPYKVLVYERCNKKQKVSLIVKRNLSFMRQWDVKVKWHGEHSLYELFLFVSGF